ncbi:LysR family transcriptional regulator [Amnibacterium kyonggiense]|uniref:Transcriptional regulator n=1 Tax=Amnibacterium kyonggiense TaxID=595671 RepID=A0A4R7FH74_9MICO|nr:LysR family transcriptional regulator [Amnibacterium kyonggiense]TDS76087.1 transcriptional regulator [Amnibacterium kyonggiense]
MTEGRLPDLEALRLLLAVHEGGSLGAAARRLGISQPAASQRIRTLEAQLGFPLLERGATGSRPTASGELVATWAAPLVAAAAAFRRDVEVLAGEPRQLSVAASLTVADYLMPRWLVALHDLLPGITIASTSVNSPAVAALVRSGDAALGFVEGPRTPPELVGRTVGRDRLVLVVAPGHPWGRRTAPVEPEELIAGTLLLREPTSGTRQVLDRALASRHLVARPALELGSTTALKHAVASGRGATVLSRLAVEEDVAAGRLVQVDVAGLRLARSLRAVWRPQQPPSGPAGALLAVAERDLAPGRR